MTFFINFSSLVLGVLGAVAVLALFKSFKRDPIEKAEGKEKPKWKTDYNAQDPEYMKRLEEERTKPQKPQVYRGKRGGKYTKGKTKEGGSYRRYF